MWQVIYNRQTDQSRGFGFVTMSTVEEAEKAVEMLHHFVSFSLDFFFDCSDEFGLFSYISLLSCKCRDIKDCTFARTN